MGISHFGCGEYPVGYWEYPTLVVGKTHFGCWENPLWLLGHGQIWNLGLGTDHFGFGENPVWLRGKFFGCWDENPLASEGFNSPLPKTTQG